VALPYRSEAASVGGLFIFERAHRRDVAFWHFASFRCAAIVWSLLDQQQTKAGDGAAWLGRE